MNNHDEAVEDDARIAACEAIWERNGVDGQEAGIIADLAIDTFLSTYLLPCDVTLPPATTIRKGCSAATLFKALSMPDRAPVSTYGAGDELVPKSEREFWDNAQAITTLKAQAAELERERDEALEEHTDMMWQRRRADERAEALEAENVRLREYVSEAEQLINHLDAHEGAEGWSKNLRTHLRQWQETRAALSTPE